MLQPHAPPMVFKLPDGKLLSLTHNNRGAGKGAQGQARISLWGLVSEDKGQTWSEPRFILANAALDLNSESVIPDDLEAKKLVGGVTYADLVVDGETLHIFLDRSKRQILQFSFTLDDLAKMSLESDL